MAKSTIIPMRPENFKTQLSPGEQTCLTWYVLSGCPKEDAYLTFARPDMADSKAKAVVKETIRQFYARADVKDYLMAYRTTIEDFVNPKRREKEPVQSGTLEEKKTRALTQLVEYVLGEAENITTAEDPKAILDYANRIGLFEVEEVKAEEPRRYLPVTCSGCAYRKFVEENCDEVPDGTDIARNEESR